MINNHKCLLSEHVTSSVTLSMARVQCHAARLCLLVSNKLTLLKPSFLTCVLSDLLTTSVIMKVNTFKQYNAPGIKGSQSVPFSIGILASMNELRHQLARAKSLL